VCTEIVSAGSEGINSMKLLKGNRVGVGPSSDIGIDGV